MFAIFKREIRSYFQTVVGWLFIAAVLALYGLYFYFVFAFRSFIYCDDCGTGTYHAELCGGTAYKDRSADVNFPGSAWKDRVWQISCHGRSFLHCNDRCCADTVIFIHLWFCAARRKLCGGFGILAVWLRMYCDRYADVSGNGKSGYRSSAWICSTVSWLHDVEYYQHDLTER